MIVGEKTLLSGVLKSDFKFIYECSNDPELKENTGTLFPISEFEHEKWLEKKCNSTTEKLFIVLDKELKDPVGIVGLKNIDYKNSNAELYIVIASNFIGKKGYGSSAIKSLLNFCFSRLNLHKVYLYVFKTNIKAILCYKKCGFKVEGELREHHFEKGEYSSTLIMSVLRKDFIQCINT